MKKLQLCLVALLSLPAFLHAQVTVSGEWLRRHDGNVKLYRIEHGRLEEVAASKPGTDSAFGFYFKPEREGFYVIGTGSTFTPQDKYTFYFRKKDQLNLKVVDTTYVLTGQNSPENQAVEKWHNTVLPLERKGIYFSMSRSTYVDFFPLLEKIHAQVRQTKYPSTGNKTFDAEFAVYREMDLLFCASELLSTPRSVHPSAADYTAYLKGINPSYFTADTRLLRYPQGMRMMRTIQALPARMGHGDPRDYSLEARLKGVENDTLKGEVVLQHAAGLKTYLGYTDMSKDYGKYILTRDQSIRAKAFETELAKKATAAGGKAVNFTYPDANGKNVSLSDFKGKVVLVDVWATWCGPCKGEIPHLKKLEKEMHGQDVLFLSVSVDELKDHQKWKDFIKSEELGGVQLFASGWSDIAKFYNIKGIPRFMVFDKQGNIVSTDAPRPSNKELKLLLESEVKK
ncbi:TlpA family protein disulfide reductase [Chitinophaga sp. GCM10012297]|uniref:TlpA family protein disulfide reductase n=1 Tax=Chitinophaga chungangae TaxID=2821488 RepID=A0ABS3YG27_9BACT|nr:TlpA disulfide reductase family protein [Chitinophaga chungangae]MBO9153635.1 TlpA family protein disulfide reductase [Chitinophaga chungangae]